MGVSLTAKNSIYDFYMGYGGFFNLRKSIASILDEDFGQNYANLAHCFTVAQFEKNDEIANWIIGEKNLDPDIIEFLYAPDTGAKISYKTCGKIYKLIKDVDFGNKIFTYGAYSDGKDYEHLKEFLKDCYSHRKNAYWE